MRFVSLSHPSHFWTDFSEAGISRSVTLVCAHLMKKHKWSMEEALARIREKRPAAE
jgi:hypothetical protein